MKIFVRLDFHILILFRHLYAPYIFLYTVVFKCLI